jgi:dienelactone hydrolase
MAMTRKLLFFSIVLTAVLFCISVARAQIADNTGHQEGLSKHYRLEKPKAAGPFPVVMMVPGCSGFEAEFQKEFFDSIQKQLVELGFVTLRVDYLAARNVSSCANAVSTEQVATDIGIAAEYLKKQAFVKRGSLNVLGWSYGAAGALQALGSTHSRGPVKVDAVVTYYPACNFVQQRWDSEVPVLCIVGMLDNVAPERSCTPLFSGLPNERLIVRTYKDTHHGFDNFTLPAEMQYRFGTMGYNESAAKSAWLEVTNFLRK